jgi:hypothetical protein
MPSDSDDLEQQLRENLKLRRELAAQVDKARSASQRLSCGFHRLGLFLASIALLMGSITAILFAPDWTVPFPEKMTLSLVIPQPKPQWARDDVGGGPIIDVEGIGKVRMPDNYSDQTVDQQQDLVNRIVATNWRTKVARPLVAGLAIAFAISLAVYGLVRAIEMIGGFISS